MEMRRRSGSLAERSILWFCWLVSGTCYELAARC
jgi:hypothetical protein